MLSFWRLLPTLFISLLWFVTICSYFPVLWFLFMLFSPCFVVQFFCCLGVWRFVCFFEAFGWGFPSFRSFSLLGSSLYPLSSPTILSLFGFFCSVTLLNRLFLAGRCVVPLFSYISLCFLPQIPRPVFLGVGIVSSPPLQTPKTGSSAWARFFLRLFFVVACDRPFFFFFFASPWSTLVFSALAVCFTFSFIQCWGFFWFFSCFFLILCVSCPLLGLLGGGKGFFSFFFLFFGGLTVPMDGWAHCFFFFVCFFLILFFFFFFYCCLLS